MGSTLITIGKSLAALGISILIGEIGAHGGGKLFDDINEFIGDCKGAAEPAYEYKKKHWYSREESAYDPKTGKWVDDAKKGGK